MGNGKTRRTSNLFPRGEDFKGEESFVIGGGTGPSLTKSYIKLTQFEKLEWALIYIFFAWNLIVAICLLILLYASNLIDTDFLYLVLFLNISTSTLIFSIVYLWLGISNLIIENIYNSNLSIKVNGGK